MASLFGSSPTGEEEIQKPLTRSYFLRYPALCPLLLCDTQNSRIHGLLLQSNTSSRRSVSSLLPADTARFRLFPNTASARSPASSTALRIPLPKKTLSPHCFLPLKRLHCSLRPLLPWCLPLRSPKHRRRKSVPLPPPKQKSAFSSLLPSSPDPDPVAADLIAVNGGIFLHDAVFQVVPLSAV